MMKEGKMKHELTRIEKIEQEVMNIGAGIIDKVL